VPAYHPPCYHASISQPGWKAIPASELAIKLVRAADTMEVDLEPLQSLWTETHYLKLTDQTNHLIEFTNGVIEALPMPTRRHQVILAFLYKLFAAYICSRGGKVLFAPLRLQVAPRRFREPDLLLLRDIGDPRNQNAFWLGADLVVEIVHPDDRERDTLRKRHEYAGVGSPEYWIVDPENKTIVILKLNGNLYTEHGVFGRGQTARSALLGDFQVSVEAVFDAQ